MGKHSKIARKGQAILMGKSLFPGGGSYACRSRQASSWMNEPRLAQSLSVWDMIGAWGARRWGRVCCELEGSHPLYRKGNRNRLKAGRDVTSAWPQPIYLENWIFMWNVLSFKYLQLSQHFKKYYASQSWVSNFQLPVITALHANVSFCFFLRAHGAWNRGIQEEGDLEVFSIVMKEKVGVCRTGKLEWVWEQYHWSMEIMIDMQIWTLKRSL